MQRKFCPLQLCKHHYVFLVIKVKFEKNTIEILNVLFLTLVIRNFDNN